MTTSPDPNNQAGYRPWVQAMQTWLSVQWKLFEVQYHMGASFLEGAFLSSGGRPGTGSTSSSDVAELERLATDRVNRGFAPPREIYQVPYRDRIDWTKFPDWAKPSDPELFAGSGHEG